MSRQPYLIIRKGRSRWPPLDRATDEGVPVLSVGQDECRTAMKADSYGERLCHCFVVVDHTDVGLSADEDSAAGIE